MSEPWVSQHIYAFRHGIQPPRTSLTMASCRFDTFWVPYEPCGEIMHRHHQGSGLQECMNLAVHHALGKTIQCFLTWAVMKQAHGVPVRRRAAEGQMALRAGNQTTEVVSAILRCLHANQLVRAHAAPKWNTISGRMRMRMGITDHARHCGSPKIRFALNNIGGLRILESQQVLENTGNKYLCREPQQKGKTTARPAWVIESFNTFKSVIGFFGRAEMRVAVMRLFFSIAPRALHKVCVAPNHAGKLHHGPRKNEIRATGLPSGTLL
ncbi:hypothetical protein B0H14DRAFT_3610621 [Mycena olivaceomarginata]|nr:hypothetical protein B0H14DRAFT_3610621 [Mycena olivaceomarginata]